MRTAKSMWLDSRPVYDDYISYIESKKERFHLTIIDLFYIKNFKGGSAVFSEGDKKVNARLLNYSELLKKIHTEKWRTGKLSDLENDELSELIKYGVEVLNLAKAEDSKIKGLGPSFSSTLLHFYFPQLFPILDRRVIINGFNITKKEQPPFKVLKSNQIKDIENHYPSLIKLFHEKKQNVVDIDKELFSIEIVDFWSK